MNIFGKPLKDLARQDIQSLLDNKVPEGVGLDYKLETYENNEKGNKEILKDISAFANTVGGHIILGIDEKERVPVEIVGIEIDLDAFTQRIENLMRTRTEPPIRGVQTPPPVEWENGKQIIIIDVPKSVSRPHAVRTNDYYQFYTRGSSGINTLAIDEIRKAFLQSEIQAERIRNYRKDRLAQIVTGEELPIQITGEAKIVLHLIPVASFEIGKEYDLEKVSYEEVPPLYFYDISYKRNFDGLLTYHDVGEDAKTKSYCQVFKKGIIEVVDTTNIISSGKYIHLDTLENELIARLAQYIKAYEKIGVEFPIWICMSLLGVKGYKTVWGTGIYTRQGYNLIDRNELIIPEIFMEGGEIPSSKILKSAFDSIWQAGGYKGSMNYDKEGNRRKMN